MVRYLLLLCLAAMVFAAMGNPAPPKGEFIRVPSRSRPNRRPVSQRETGGDAAAAETADAAEGDGEEPANGEGAAEETDCKKEVVDSTQFHWTSPNFGIGDYPNDAFCQMTSSSAEPSYTTVNFNTLDVLCEGRGDAVTFKQPVHINDIAGKTYCGMMSEPNQITTILPTSNFNSRFRTDHSGTGVGFNATFTQGTTDCHMIIEAGTDANSGIIETPTEPNAGPLTICEWWIKAPFGKNIELQFFEAESKNSDCSEGSTIVDISGSKFYRRKNTKKFCGKAILKTLISKKNYMNILFFSHDANDHITARWSLVNAF